MCLCVYKLNVCRCPERAEEHIRSSGTGGIGGCEPPDMALGTEPGPLQYQEALLTAEPSLQTPQNTYNISKVNHLNFN